MSISASCIKADKALSLSSGVQFGSLKAFGCLHTNAGAGSENRLGNVGDAKCCLISDSPAAAAASHRCMTLGGGGGALIPSRNET